MQVDPPQPNSVGYSASSLSVSSAITTTVSCDQQLGGVNSSSRDVTCKPTPIMTYPPIPIYAFNSPKNPSGVSPFQPTGKLRFLVLTILTLKKCQIVWLQVERLRQCQLVQRVRNQCRIPITAL